MNEVDRNYMIAELRALDADALYGRSKSLIRLGNESARHGMLCSIDRLWRDLLRAEWGRRGNFARYEQAFKDVAKQKEEERMENIWAAAKWGKKQHEGPA